MQDIPAHPRRKLLLRARVAHDFFRASIITVDPARHVASRIVNGRDATTMPKYSRSLKIRAFPLSFTLRTRRAIGSSAGARLLASPAGLSRNEKYLWRNTSKPQ